MSATEKTPFVPKNNKRDDFSSTKYSELDDFCGINEQNMNKIFSVECMDGLKDADSKYTDRLKKVHEEAAEPSNRFGKFFFVPVYATSGFSRLFH